MCERCNKRTQHSSFNPTQPALFCQLQTVMYGNLQPDVKGKCAAFTVLIMGVFGTIKSFQSDDSLAALRFVVLLSPWFSVKDGIINTVKSSQAWWAVLQRLLPRFFRSCVQPRRWSMLTHLYLFQTNCCWCFCEHKRLPASRRTFPWEGGSVLVSV